MKTIITAVMVIILSACYCFADDPPEVYCSHVGDLAREIMIKRQDNFPVAQLVEIAENGSAPITTKALILEAYQRDLQETDDLKQLAVDVFVNDIYVRCLLKQQER